MEESRSLKKNAAGSLASREVRLSAGTLEKALLSVFPKEDACSWDYTGMYVGNPAEEVHGVAVALDPTVRAMKEAVDAGANVLVTHHPVFLDAPTCFTPFALQGQTSGAGVHYALTHGLSVMSFHTACDASVEGLGVLPALLRLNQVGGLDSYDHNPNKGFGALCTPQEELSLQHLSARCVSVFGSFPRVWGDPSAKLDSIATCGGSAGSVLGHCLTHSVDCLVCGELKYHDALDAAESGLAIIELGHDVSELPLCALLATEVVKAGIPESCVTILNQENNWYIPEALRR